MKEKDENIKALDLVSCFGIVFGILGLTLWFLDLFGMTIDFFFE